MSLAEMCCTEHCSHAFRSTIKSVCAVFMRDESDGIRGEGTRASACACVLDSKIILAVAFAA